MRNNLSGIFIFDKLEGDEQKLPTCIEDCNENTRNEWLETLDEEALIRTVHRLCNVLKSIGDQFGIVGK